MKLILHNHILHIHKISKDWGLNVKKNSTEIMSKLLEIAKDQYPDCHKLLIPAFNYQPFATKKINTKEIHTKFAFASIILTSKAKAKIDIVYDPVFSYISYPGTGEIIGNENTIYKPFNDPKKFLDDEDIIGFTKNAFEPSHLMEIENKIFGQDHPYRYNKMFVFTNFDQRQVKFHYMVRPKDDRLTVYDLNTIYAALIAQGLLIESNNIGIQYIKYKDLKDYTISTCRNNSFGLLNAESQDLIYSIAKDARIPESYFL